MTGAKGTKYSIKGTSRTCWKELEFCVGKKGVGSKNMTLVDIWYFFVS